MDLGTSDHRNRSRKTACPQARDMPLYIALLLETLRLSEQRFSLSAIFR